MTKYLVNAFSLNMLLFAVETTVKFTPLGLEEARAYSRANKLTPAVGHADTARVVDGLLGLEAQGETPASYGRINVSLVEGDEVLVAQYTGPRLPEGATTLPEGAVINFWLATVTDA